MTNQEIFELLDRFERSGIGSMKLRCGDFSLELNRTSAVQSAPEVIPVKDAPSAEQSTPAQAICAPLAGVFYAASEPGARPYVAVGDKVKAGETVCLMEAMKMISEVPAPCDCIITEIVKENGKLAAYGEPLLRYQPCSGAC